MKELAILKKIIKTQKNIDGLNLVIKEIERLQKIESELQALQKAYNKLKEDANTERLNNLLEFLELKKKYEALQKMHEEAPVFQERVDLFIRECFGDEVADNVAERNMRFLEEAVELVQACDMSKEKAHAMVDFVYGRPVGETKQEVGGVMVTLASLCSANKVEMTECAENELNRVLPLKDELRRRWLKKPRLVVEEKK